MRLGRYEIQSELARGGQGCVYLALDPHTGDRVVLKLLESHDPRRRRRLVREARALADLDHPCVLRLRDLGEHEGLPFLVLPYVEGQSLQDRIDRGGPLPLEQALEIAQQVGAGLRAVHACGLVHRDLKPANVLLSGEGGGAKLADFGIVKDLDRDQAQTQQLTGTGQYLGTPGYWPFEQVQGAAEVGPAADVYAFAATLYAALSGGPPREAVTLVEAFAAFDRPVKRLGGETPPWLDDLLQRCLTRHAEERPPLDAVLQALASRRPLGEDSPRSRSWAPLALILLLAGLTAAGLALAFRGDSAAELKARANALLESGDVEASLELFDAALELAPDDADCLADRGLAHYRVGEHELALADLERAVELNPNDARAWSNRGAILQGQGDHAGALDCYSRAIQLRPDYAAAYVNRSALHVDRDEFQAALVDADRALELAPDVPDALYNRGLAHQELEQLAAALADYDRCLELDPDRLEALASRAKARWDMGDEAGSLADYSRVLTLDPLDQQMFRQRARVYLQLRDFEAAESDYSRALELEPEPTGYSERGFVRYQLGDYARALVDYDAALKLDGSLVDTLFNRGMTYVKLNDLARALDDFERGLRLDPNHPQAQIVRTRADECRAVLEGR